MTPLFSVYLIFNMAAGNKLEFIELFYSEEQALELLHSNGNYVLIRGEMK